MFKFDTSSLTATVQEAVNQLTGALGESTLRAAGFAGAKVFREGAKERLLANGSVISGVVLRNIIVKRLDEKSESNQRQVYLVTVRSGKYGTDGDAFYWRWVEGGHSFVRRNPSKKNWKAHRAASKLEYGDASAQAKPFMRPTFDSKQEVAIGEMKNALIAALDKLKGIP